MSTELDETDDREPIPVSIESPAVQDVKLVGQTGTQDVNVLESKDVHDYDRPQEVKLDPKLEKALTDTVAAGGKGATPQPKLSNVDNVLNVPPKTTAEQDLKSAGQRQINLIWETTQRHIALFVVAIGCSVSAAVVLYSVVKGTTADPLVLAAFTLLSNICFLVAGFYFGRTNHARIGDDSKGSSEKMDTR